MTHELNDTFASHRRQFLRHTGCGLGSVALAALLRESSLSESTAAENSAAQRSGTHFEPKAKRVIYLFQSGAPSQMDLFDHKPQLDGLRATELPESIRRGQRLTGMTSRQASFPIAPSMFRFAKHGKSGTSISELLLHTAKVADELCVIKSMHTEAINHDPAITFFQTGNQLAGRPSIGSWLSYGLGSENADLPAFVVMISNGSGNPADQPLYDRLWGSGFLPSKYQGVKFRSVGDPVLYLSNPPGQDAATRRRMLDDLAELNRLKLDEYGDPEIATRISQYELAYRMQSSVPELTDTSKEPEHIFDLYGPDSRKPGTFAANCLLARRLAERGTRFIQLFHRGWDQHLNLPKAIRGQCKDTDQASAALILDLKQRGLLDSTIVLFASEFGRTPGSQGADGRDHHIYGFSVWMAGGGIKGGIVHGATDEIGFHAVEHRHYVTDIHATILHQLGLDSRQLEVPGRKRLDIDHGKPITEILA